jgi:hypothetical protein
VSARNEARPDRRGPGRWVAAAAMAVLLVQLSTAAALAAARGVALDSGRITVETPLVGGRSYQLAKLTVRNPGSLKTKYDLVVTPIETDARTPDAAWFSFSPRQVTLAAGKRQAVAVSMRLPANAAPGRYEVLIGARVAPSAPGMSIGAAAASRLTFVVAAPPSAVESSLELLQTWWPISTAAALGIGLILVRTRVRIRLERRQE